MNRQARARYILATLDAGGTCADVLAGTGATTTDRLIRWCQREHLTDAAAALRTARTREQQALTRAAWCEDVEVLLSTGAATAGELAARMGCPTVGALHKRLTRYGRDDLAARLRDRDRPACHYERAA